MKVVLKILIIQYLGQFYRRNIIKYFGEGNKYKENIIITFIIKLKYIFDDFSTADFADLLKEYHTRRLHKFTSIYF